MSSSGFNNHKNPITGTGRLLSVILNFSKSISARLVIGMLNVPYVSIIFVILLVTLVNLVLHEQSLSVERRLEWVYNAKATIWWQIATPQEQKQFASVILLSFNKILTL